MRISSKGGGLSLKCMFLLPTALRRGLYSGLKRANSLCHQRAILIFSACRVVDLGR